MGVIGQLPPLRVELTLAVSLSTALLMLWLFDRWRQRHQ